ncbi:toxin HicA [Geminocystis sp. CENA526]|uniref:toxin HicA n=1 Tax=Geminocystis sp. CENA526 TaxID=1355871 RepID=UPI003D6FFA85
MDINKAIEELVNDKNIRFARLMKITESFFGEPRNRGSSHYPFKVPWKGEPRINLQEGKQGKAKPYQVKQVRLALIKLREIQEGKNND